MITRRFLLAGAGLAGAAAIAAPAVLRSPKHAMATEPQPLRVPPLIDARQQDQSIALNVEAGQTEFFPGRASETLGYNGSYLGPTLRLHRGDDVAMAVTNTLNEDTTLHWHGLVVPGEIDGSPHQTIGPRKIWSPVLPIRQPAATLWYHSHALHRTADQVYAGLAGFLLIADEEEQALGLPSDYGVDDLPIVVQDRQFENGQLVMPDGMMALMQGRRGDTLLANGTVNPFARVGAGLIRLRLLNGANARIFHFSFDDDRFFHWIASDGGLLEQPVPLRSLSLAPGQRGEILVDFSDRRAVTLQTAPDTNAPMMMGMMQRFGNATANLLGTEKQPVIHFQVEGGGRNAAVPDRLASMEHLSRQDAVRERRMSLTMGMGGMMGGGGSGGMMGGGGPRGMMGGGGPRSMMGAFGINNRPFDIERINEQVRLGDVEIWEVAGEMMAHPFHMHGVQFEVLSRNGRAPEAADQGLRDTILVREPIELIVRFTQPGTQAPFMYHCHILEHEDNGMMGQFRVQ
ncbi:multicopper oxidase family protein [Aurantimonas marina]|uniref:multicopper oxidase family protein n=1 Tax=Aurantimonas marina TaxID=2780508 RepID=UPI0019CF6AB2|nr:multicopper oxidase domain-containing protein [Aurantimonas marina]